MEIDDTDNTILSRISLREISVLSEDEDEENIPKKSPLSNDERKWRLSYLRNQFESYKLHNLFKIYTEKVNHGYFSLFLILQFLLSLTHFSFVVFSNLDTLEIVLPDLILYGMTIILSLLGLYIVDEVAEKYKKLNYISTISFAIVVFVCNFVPYYHWFKYGSRFRPAYSPHLIVACYLFISIDNLMVATSIGCLMSLFHMLTLYLVTYSSDEVIWKKIASDAIFAAFVNGLGIYYRYMNEIVIRRSFLDRRDCIMSTSQLQHEKMQVDQLMKSIIPDYVIKKVKERYIHATKTFIEHGRYLKENPFNNFLLDEHENVSILFADIVNYTEMTSKLKITDLLETLNDLFGLFDDSSAKLQVTRIKFLGDCYYCVAGLPPEVSPNPAEACVDLGLEMISIIADVRKKRTLNVNMRIGVHSGKIISGIIGSVKYQFDIWSKDVDIANKMESEGESGMVHITNKTKALLRKPYFIEPTNKGETCPQFKACGIQTFLVKPIEKQVKNQTDSAPSSPTPRPSLFKKQRSFPNGTLLAQLQRIPSMVEEEPNKKLTFIEDANRYRNSDERIYRKKNNFRASEARRSTSAWKRRTAFMNNNIKRYTERAEKVNDKMAETINNISFSKYQQYMKEKEINFFLLFKNLKIELEYMKIPDALFKYYLIGAICLIFCVYLIQNLTLKSFLKQHTIGPIVPLFFKMLENNDSTIVLGLSSIFLNGFCSDVFTSLHFMLHNDSCWDKTTWPYLLTTMPIACIFIPISWAEYLFNKYLASYSNEIPKNSFLRVLCRASTVMANHFFVRLAVFLLIYLAFLLSVFNEMIDCRTNFDDEMSNIKNTTTRTNLIFLIFFAESSKTGEGGMIHCVLPWHMTETYAMAVIMSFLFLRIFIWIKLVLGTATIALYGFCVLSFSSEYYKSSETFNHNLQPQVAHIISTLFLTITLHLVDRQTDYMNRLDYLLNRRFMSEQEEANLLQKVNENLLVNILPKHVAVLYLDVNREQKELYFEEHNNVAVMFASIITDNELADILDEKEFLRLMNTYITEFDILTNRKEFQSIEKIKIAKWTYMVACGLFPGGRANEIERHQTSASLETLLNFASEMFKKLEYVNRTHLQKSQLRIGISHGEIAAGVVGSKKPLYDIWGDPVNMASRMDSTGLPNRIQAMEATAEIVQKLGYSCTKRGDIKVKGKYGLVTTYFIEIDDKFNLVRESKEQF